MQLATKVINKSVVDQIEQHIMRIRIMPADTINQRYKDASLLLLKTHRKMNVNNNQFIDKRLCSVLTDILKNLVPFMTVKSYEEINDLLKLKKE